MKPLGLSVNNTSQQLLSLYLVFMLLACALLTPNAYAADEDWFAPDNLYFYNPLKNSSGSRSYHGSTLGMNDDALFQAAKDHRDNSMSASQRALNHQWLQQD